MKPQQIEPNTVAHGDCVELLATKRNLALRLSSWPIFSGKKARTKTP